MRDQDGEPHDLSEEPIESEHSAGHAKLTRRDRAHDGAVVWRLENSHAEASGRQDHGEGHCGGGRVDQLDEQVGDEEDEQAGEAFTPHSTDHIVGLFVAPHDTTAAGVV